MKVIDLGNRILFTDDILYIYNKERTGEYRNYTDYYIVTEVGTFEVDKYEYAKVKEYLLSLNDEPKDDTFEILFNTLNGRCKKLIDYIDDLKDSKLISIKIAKDIKDIIQSGF